MRVRPTEGEPDVQLLHDLGAAQARTLAVDERPGELMRLASDPLLLHQFLRRSPARPLTPASCGELPLQLATPPAAPKTAPPLMAAYRDNDPRRAGSVRPEVFYPSGEDLQEALCESAAVAPQGGPARRGGRPGAIAGITACASLILLLLLLL